LDAGIAGEAAPVVLKKGCLLPVTVTGGSRKEGG
jgi:hypothetical protein